MRRFKTLEGLQQRRVQLLVQHKPIEKSQPIFEDKFGEQEKLRERGTCPGTVALTYIRWQKIKMLAESSSRPLELQYR